MSVYYDTKLSQLEDELRHALSCVGEDENGPEMDRVESLSRERKRVKRMLAELEDGPHNTRLLRDAGASFGVKAGRFWCTVPVKYGTVLQLTKSGTAFPYYVKVYSEVESADGKHWYKMHWPEPKEDHNMRWAEYLENNPDAAPTPKVSKAQINESLQGFKEEVTAKLNELAAKMQQLCDALSSVQKDVAALQQRTDGLEEYVHCDLPRVVLDRFERDAVEESYPVP